MPCPPRSTVLSLSIALSLLAPAGLLAQDPPKPVPKAETPAPKNQEDPTKGDSEHPPILVFKDEIKTLPPVAIPDDPPPHEGAMIDLPLTIEPPDIIIVEVLEAMPGRPITGERLVRPDGTISLGFYGDFYVRGLTLTQVKEKVAIHLRKYIGDSVLGLLVFNPEGVEGEVMPEEGIIPFPKGGRNPFDLDRKEKKPDAVPESVPPVEKKPQGAVQPAEKKEGRPSALRTRQGRSKRLARLRTSTMLAQDPPNLERLVPLQDPLPPEPKAQQEMVVIEVEEGPVPGHWSIVPPADSNRIFVDIVSFNTKVYYVQGDVGTPGRLPWTGNETVLDALNYAGGFVPTAEPTDIHLYRPARGEKPAKDYKLDLDAIRKGDARANLQMFPNDRLIVGRNPIVAKTIEVDRAAGLVNSIMNSIMQYIFSSRTLGVMNSPPAGGTDSIRVKVNGQNLPMNVADPTVMTQAQREAQIKEWAEFFWSISSKEGETMLDEKAFKEALMKKLTPAPVPK